MTTPPTVASEGRPSLDDLLATSPLPPLTGPEGEAERLVLLVHRGVDWDVWGGTRRVRYWDALADRVRASTYAGPTVSEWWQDICVQITSAPQHPEDRADLAHLIATPNQRAVLNALHKHAATLVLRVRVLSETRRAARPEGTTASEPATDWLADPTLSREEKLARFDALHPHPTHGPGETP
jgi:hypothetical protein